MPQSPRPSAPPTILERISDGVAGLDHEWRFIYVNDPALRLLHRTREEVLGRCLWDLYPEAVGGPFHQVLLEAMAEQDVRSVEYYFEPLARWFENRVFPAANGVTVVFHDVSERKRAQDLLRGQAHVLELIAHGTPLERSLDALLRVIDSQNPGMHSSVLLLDASGKHLHHGAGPSLPESFTRALDGTAIGPNVGTCGAAAYLRRTVITEDIASDPNWAKWRDLALGVGLRACWSTPIQDDAEHLFGTFAIYYDRPAIPSPEDRATIRTAAHVAAIAIAHARAENLRTEQERIRRKNRALEEASRVAQEASRLKSRFLANMSHELRTPLNAVIGFSEFLIDGYAGPLNEKQDECLRHVLLSGQHLLRMVDDVLDLAKVEAGKLELHPEEFRVADALHEVQSVLSGLAAAKHVALETHCEPELERVTLDVQKFKQVLFNLLSNALKFTEAGGTVTVRARGLPEQRFEVCVQDTGIGIAKYDLPKLFHEFPQIDSGSQHRHEGTGLGLALVKRLIESQHGQIGVESTPGAGTTFCFVLPRELHARHTLPSP